MSLVPLHDDEFFCGPPNTAFRTNEVSDMVKILRDVCMGIVRFMYPDRQISNQQGTITMNTIGDKNPSESVYRTSKQVEIARQRASTFSMIFKVSESFFVFFVMNYCTLTRIFR